MASALTLTEFLLARIAEDEACAEAAAAHAPGGEWITYDPDADTERAGRFGCVITGGMRPTAWPQHARHIARHDPARVLAQCEANRRIVEIAKSDVPSGTWDAAGEDHVLIEVLEVLALPYADHPDYRDEWRP